MIEIYTDGSSSKNRAGWGFVAVLDGTVIYEKAGQDIPSATNQLMELTAAIEACDWVEQTEYINEHDVIIYSDSAYLVNCYKDKWWSSWETNGWKNSKGDPVANMLSWRFLIKFFKKPNYSFQKVKGHAGNVYNERADDLAQGKATLGECHDLTCQKKCDIIYMKLSEKLKILNDDSTLINNVVNDILKILKQEGINIE